MAHEARNNLLSDEIRPEPPSIYRSAKLAAEMMTKTPAAEYRFEHISAVISNAYGAGERSLRY